MNISKYVKPLCLISGLALVVSSAFAVARPTNVHQFEQVKAKNGEFQPFVFNMMGKKNITAKISSESAGDFPSPVAPFEPAENPPRYKPNFKEKNEFYVTYSSENGSCIFTFKAHPQADLSTVWTITTIPAGTAKCGVTPNGDLVLASLM